MSAPSPSGTAGQIDGICDAFDADWREGKRPRLEDYLARVGPADRADLLRELLAVEVEYRLRQGEQPRAEEYRGRFPGDEAAVEAAFAQPAPTLAAPTRPASADAPSGEIPALLLTATDGPYKGQTYTLVGHQIFLVGRSKKAHLPIGEDRYVSRDHFMVEVNPPQCRLTDLNSRTGTFVNGERVQVADLRAGDVIKAGRTCLLVSLPSAPPEKSAGADDEAATLAPGGEGPPSHAPTGALSATAGNATAEGPDTIYSEGAPPPPVPTNHSPGVLAMAALLTPAPPSPTPAAAIPQIPGYRIERGESGRGGMGVVYLAVSERDNDRYALKTITPAVAVSGNEVRRFLREVEILGQLRHKYIVRFHEADQVNGMLYFAMEYVEGTDAKKMLKQRGPLPMKTAVSMACQLLRALEYAHDPERKFVHRDIKPANLLVASREGEAPVVKLADFGLARVYQASRMSGLTMKGEVGGTVAFMPPEQITQFRDVSALADQYSAAVTLYNLLTDRLLYSDGTARTQTMPCVLHEPPISIRERRPDLPAESAQVIHRALEKDPRDRFPDVRAFRAALIHFAR